MRKIKKELGSRMTPYGLGTLFEMRISNFLRRRGWYTVRSRGSRGAIDVACFIGNARFVRIVFLECKSSGRSTPKERSAIERVARQQHAEAYIVRELHRQGRWFVDVFLPDQAVWEPLQNVLGHGLTDSRHIKRWRRRVGWQSLGAFRRERENERQRNERLV